MNLLIHGIAEIASAAGSKPLAGKDQGRIDRWRGQALEIVCFDGRISFVGEADERRRRLGELPDLARLDARGGTLVPGWVDAHTHLPWAGTREHEFVERLAGVSYQEIAARGGGILDTVRKTRAASEDELVANTLARLDRMLEHGTTTAEVKSGYGLSLQDELKQLRAIRRAGEKHAIELVPTLMAAHEFPPEHRQEREIWVDEIVERIVPAVAAEGLAFFCDVFCEAGVFEVAQARRVLQAGLDHGLVPRLHADEFVDSGAAELAGELKASSADHLVAVSDRGIAALAEHGVIAGLLPGVSFFLRKKDYAPARRLIAANVPVALATDCNPGSCHTVSMPFVIQLGVFQLQMAIEEALVAATLNPACLLGQGDKLGTIEVGKAADLLVLNVPNLLHLGYQLGSNPVAAVIKGGRLLRHTSS
jgi:imidazolonepropionase